MSIPKGLIIYRASRYQESYPFNNKHRYYADKILLSTEVPKTDGARVFRWEYNPKITNASKIPKFTKFIQKLSLYLEAGSPKKLHIMRSFSKLKNVKKCFINFHNHVESLAQKVETLLARTLIQRVFKTLKQLEQVEMSKLGPLQKDPKTFKYLTRQRSLQKLMLVDLKYTDNPKDLEPFVKLSRFVSDHGCWKGFKDLRIDLAPSEEPRRYITGRKDVTGTLKKLLKFLQDFKSCEPLSKLSSWKFRFPDKSHPHPREVAALYSILEMKLPMTHISCSQSNQILSLFEAPENLEELQSISLQLHDSLSDYLKMTPLGEFPALQHMKLRIECSDQDNDEDPNVHFYYSAIEQIQSMTNLISLSIDFEGDRGDVQAEFGGALANLSELKYLRVKWTAWEMDEDGESLQLNRSWLKEVFQEIGKRKQLKELSLDLQDFDIKGSGRLFKTAWQNLGKLTRLTSLRFALEYGQEIKDQDVCELASHLGKLKKLEFLALQIPDSKFKTKSFVVLMDSILKNLRFLSVLKIEFHGFDVTKKCYQLVYEAIHQLKYLDKLDILIGAKPDRGLDFALLDAEARKRMDASIYCYALRN